MRLAERQRDFAEALLDPTAPVPAGIAGPDGLPSARRFAVYRNNVVVGLMEALGANFPATCRIVGEEFFRAMVRDYVALEPPTSPILLDYGAGFPHFIDQFEPARSLPYLSDVARIERCWTEAYHAPEAPRLGVDALAALAREQVAALRLALHPSLRIIRSRFPALTIWRMNVADGIPAPVDLDSGGEDALLVRPESEVDVRSLPSGGAEFITALAEGLSLAEATKRTLNASNGFELSANIAALIDAGAFVDFSLAKAGAFDVGEREMSIHAQGDES